MRADADYHHNLSFPFQSTEEKPMLRVHEDSSSPIVTFRCKCHSTVHLT